ncbi:MAG: RNA-binding S4 domain-containing protein [Bacillota bacterium]
MAIHTPFIPLDAFLKWAGLVGTGGEAKQLVKAGEVRVNGAPEARAGRKLVEGDVVSVGGRSYSVTREAR